MASAMRRTPLTRQRILDAAIKILDRDGLDHLSMRRLGDALGVKAMSLYKHKHFLSKGALLDAIHERILLSLERPTTARSWQAVVRHQAHALHRALLAHPNAIPLFATRPASTPAAIDRVERYLEVHTRTGFKPVDALAIVQLLAQLVVGHAMWATSVEVVATAKSGRTPPVGHLTRAIEKWDPQRELELGIDALIRGFERLLS
jgi:TetR/AcrR family tetracycline transcriptional repressor